MVIASDDTTLQLVRPGTDGLSLQSALVHITQSGILLRHNTVTIGGNTSSRVCKKVIGVKAT